MVRAWLPASFATGQCQSVLAGSSGKQPEICRVFALEKGALSSLWLQLPEAFWRHEAVSELVLLWRSEAREDSQIWGSTGIHYTGLGTGCFVTVGDHYVAEGDRGHHSREPGGRSFDSETIGNHMCTCIINRTEDRHPRGLHPTPISTSGACCC